MRRMRSGVGRSRSTVKPDGTSDNSERGSRTGHGKQSGSCQYGHSSRIVHRPAPKMRKNLTRDPAWIRWYILDPTSKIALPEGSRSAPIGTPPLWLIQKFYQ